MRKHICVLSENSQYLKVYRFVSAPFISIKKNCDINEWAGSAVKRKPNDIIIQIDAGADNIAKQCRSLILKYQDELCKMTMADSAKVEF